MSLAAPDLPDDVEALKAIIAERDAKIAVQDAIIARHGADTRLRDMMIAKLRARLDKQLRDRFGSSPESLEQLQLMLEDLEIVGSAEAPARSTPAEAGEKPARRPLPDHLPRQSHVLDAGKACNACGGKLKRVGEDVTEELEYIPGRFIVNRIVRPRMACACCEHFQQAQLPSRPIERGRAGPGLIAHVLVSKYADHLPLYRQSQIYARAGLELERSTLADWVGKASALLAPLAEAIGSYVRAGEAIHADDTPVDVLSPGRGKTLTGRLWTYVRDERPWGSAAAPAAVFAFSMDRKGIRPAEHLAGYRGFMHADGYAGFEELFRPKTGGVGGVREVACLAHVRRKFFDIAKDQGPSIAAEAVARIAELYAIEDEARGRPPDERARIREAKARPVFEALSCWLQGQLQRVSAKSDLAGAIRYALTRLPRLEVYLSDGRLEIDNNAAERSIRGLAIGRKNWLFAGSEAGGQTAAVAYTLIETAKLNAIDPQAWLTDVLGRIADHPQKQIEQLLPWAWRASHRDA
jgi:transposase